MSATELTALSFRVVTSLWSVTRSCLRVLCGFYLRKAKMAKTLLAFLSLVIPHVVYSVSQSKFDDVSLFHVHFTASVMLCQTRKL